MVPPSRGSAGAAGRLGWATRHSRQPLTSYRIAEGEVGILYVLGSHAERRLYFTEYLSCLLLQHHVLLPTRALSAYNYLLLSRRSNGCKRAADELFILHLQSRGLSTGSCFSSENAEYC